MILNDFHTHTNFSSDSTSTPESMIEKAISLGLNGICLTDHMDYDFPVIDGLSFQFEPNSYYTKIQQLKNTYDSKINIYMGIETGLQPHLVERYRELIEAYPFDFVIGSSHIVSGYDPYHKEFWENKPGAQGMIEYYTSIINNVKLHQSFDIYGHLDYAIRYAPNKETYNYHDHNDLIDLMLTTIIEHGKGIECNTSGYKYGLNRPHPHPHILKRYLELGGEILTIGSDGHKPEHLAYNFKQAEELLKTLGYKYYTIYTNRTPQFLPL